jgi:hypothetical protein
MLLTKACSEFISPDENQDPLSSKIMPERAAQILQMRGGKTFSC